jgi:hypothetical protein
MRTTSSLLLLLVLCGFHSVRAATTVSLALTGLVTSQEEGPMEGVLVREEDRFQHNRHGSDRSERTI